MNVSALRLGKRMRDGVRIWRLPDTALVVELWPGRTHAPPIAGRTEPRIRLPVPMRDHERQTVELESRYVALGDWRGRALAKGAVLATIQRAEEYLATRPTIRHDKP